MRGMGTTGSSEAGIIDWYGVSGYGAMVELRSSPVLLSCASVGEVTMQCCQHVSY